VDLGECLLDPAAVAVIRYELDAKFQVGVEGFEVPALRGFDGVNFERDLQPNSHGAEYRGEVVHARIAAERPKAVPFRRGLGR
jgi:hypothetical protein